MSDFLSGGWSIYIGAITILGLLACLVLLFGTSRKTVAGDTAASAAGSTGHVWDENLSELDNPLPRWWMVLFVITIVFAAGYLFFYPGLGSRAGTLGWTSTGQYEAEQAAALAAEAPIYAAFKDQPVPALAKNPQAMATAERLFANTCAQCHGADARGSKGFPNLTDTDWLWGGEPEKIEETIREGRQGTMPVMAAAVGSAEDVKNVANYVLSLSGSPHDSIRAAAGKSKFVVCAACHGPEGKGTPALGAPNLTDKVWLHGWGEQAIVNMVTNGKTNTMPAHKDRLTPEQIHVLAAWVWGRSNGGVGSSTSP